MSIRLVLIIDRLIALVCEEFLVIILETALHSGAIVNRITSVNRVRE